MKKMPSILIIDDERNTREGLKLALEDNYQVFLAENALKGLDTLRHQKIDMVLTDLRMPGIDGIDFIKQVNTSENPPLIVLLTAYGSIQTALEAMKAGAYDYVSKPVDIDNLEAILQRGLATRSIEEAESEQEDKALDFIAESPAMRQVVEKIRQVADSRATVLLTGESGTGKEVIAQAIHRLSSRVLNPFVPVHCAALNDNLLESELFGHEKGAYTGADEKTTGRFENADKGTLFLDEIGEISLATQVKLLRVLETKTFERVGGKTPITVDARLIAATNRDLPAMVAKGTFREDLYYRLNVITITLPPLRERKEDIAPLLRYHLNRVNQENGRAITGFSADAIEMLTAYRWPGNVRELRNCVERMVVLAHGNVLTVTDIPKELLAAIATQMNSVSSGEKIDSPATIEEKTASIDIVPEVKQPTHALENQGKGDLASQEKEAILKALEECQGNRTYAAEKLGISRRTLQRRLKEYGLQ